MKHRKISLVVLIASLGGAWGTAVAQVPAGPREPADEDALLTQGLGLREKGEDEAALRVFRSAYDASGSARALAQIALAEQALGRWVEAESHLLQALGRPDDAWISQRRRSLNRSLAEIQDHLGVLELVGGPSGAQVMLDGQAAGTLPLAGPLRVQAGGVALEIRSPGYLPIVRTVIVRVRGTSREQVDLVASTDPPDLGGGVKRKDPGGGTSQGESRGVPLPTKRTAAIAFAAAGGASLVAGITFHVIREDRASNFNGSGCFTSGGAVAGPAGCQSQYDGVQSAGTVAIIGYVGAALLGGAAAAFALWARNDHGDATAVASKGRGFTCAVGIDRLSCGGQF